MGIRRVREEEHENNERWVLSYADFITLMFAFFVVMYSISSVNEGKYKVLSESMVEAFQPLKPSDNTVTFEQQNHAPEFSVIEFPDWMKPMELAHDKIDDPLDDEFEEKELALEKQQDQLFENITSDIENALTDFIGEGLVSVVKKDLWVEVEIKSKVLFDSGEVQISGVAEPIILALAETVSDLLNKIKVEGHTDNIPIVTDIYPSNWQLSAARAVAVVQLMIDGGVRPERLAAVGLGQFQPLATNFSVSGRARNRRVVIIISKFDVVPGPKKESLRVPTRLRSEGVSEDVSEEVSEEVLDEAGERLDSESRVIGSGPIKPIRLKGGGLLFTRESLESQALDVESQDAQ